MGTPMTTSKMTEPQINRACDLLRAKLKKHASELPSDAVQQAFGDPTLSQEWLTSLRKRVDAVRDMIVRSVSVDRSCTPQDVLDATGRKQYTDSTVVKAMPHGVGEEVEVHFFKLGRFVSDSDLKKEYELRGLVPVDPYSLAQVNTDDPTFGDERPNGTHWKDVDDNWCFATFDRWLGGRSVDVSRRDNDWGDRWWFGGVRK